MEGQTPWDVFLGKANKNVFMQLDIGHCLHGGGDPVAVLHKYAGRAITVHVKEWSPDNRAALVGEGNVKWPDVFEACESVGGTEWYIIEEESRSYEGLDGIDRSIQNLKSCFPDRYEYTYLHASASNTLVDGMEDYPAV